MFDGVFSTSFPSFKKKTWFVIRFVCSSECVTITSLIPSLFNVLSVSSTIFSDATSNELVGSSNRSIWGLLANVLAKLTHCCSPTERSLVFLSRNLGGRATFLSNLINPSVEYSSPTVLGRILHSPARYPRTETVFAALIQLFFVTLRLGSCQTRSL